VSPAEIAELRRLVDSLVKAGESGERRQFLECDFGFHKYCWKLSRNHYLAERSSG
jgi:DNA-binding GntR family transcriptional regulator